MAANAGVTLDTIVIEIESSAEKANRNLGGLTKTLMELKSAVKGGFNNLSKLATSLKELNQASDNIPKTVEKLSAIGEITTTLNGLAKIQKPLGLTSAVKNIEKIPEVFAKIDDRALVNVARVSNALAISLTPLANKMAEIGQGFSKVQMLADRYGVSVTKIKEKTRSATKETSKFEDGLEMLLKRLMDIKDVSADFGKAGFKTFDKLYSKIKQIGLSLLGTRTLFTATRKAVGEYMQMDAELTWTTQNLWRALGAQLAPAIEYVLYLFKQFVRVIYSVVYALTGIDLIARANAKALQAMGKAAKDALGNLQKFDDLNVVEFDKGSGDNNFIELDKIDLTPIQKVIDWMNKLKKEIKEAWASGEWGSVAETFLQGIADGIDSIPWYELGIKVKEAIENVPWKEIWDGIVEIAKESFGGLTEFINGLFGQDEDSKFGENLLLSLLGIYGVIQLIKGAHGLGGILEALGLIEKSPSLIAISKWFLVVWGIVLAIKQVFDTWSDFLKNPSWDAAWDTFFDTLLGIAGVIGLIAALFGAWPVALIAAIAMIVVLIGKFLYENLDKINEWAYNVGVSIRKKLDDAWEKIKKGWNDMWTAFKSGPRATINWIIDLFNSMINNINRKFSIRVGDTMAKLLRGLGINISSGTYQLFTIPNIPKLETGTNEIPYEGLYHLHPGEAVVPKKYNPALGNGTDEEVGQKLDTLISIMNNMNFTNIVNLGNKTLYKEQQKYNALQNDIYGTTVNL